MGGNPYANFVNLLPKQVKTIGRIVSVESDGTVKVTNVANTTSFIVKGGTDSYVAGDYVFIIDGIINSKLPDAQPLIIEVQVP